MRSQLCYPLLIVIIMMFQANVNSQGISGFKEKELGLKEAFNKINLGESDSARLARSMDFQRQLRNVLSLPGSGSYPWDSLKFVAKLESPDDLFRLYNWNVPMINGGNRYFCLIQFKGKSVNIPCITLTDRSDSIIDPEHFRADSLHWYGALYYKIIPFKMKNKKAAYILLGWDGFSSDIHGKLIDVLMLDGNGVPEFGAAAFPGYRDGKMLRIIFRFSSSAGMRLRYELQPLAGKPVWMIVFDHLVPLDPQLEGQYNFYVPASETAEGFIYENYEWKYIKEFEARNH